MKPIVIGCEEMLPAAPADIAEQILILANWPGFQGYGPVPGVKSAVFDLRTPEIVGSHVRVTNMDGSSHIEEFVVWEPNQRIRFEMKSFTAPLSKYAALFEETFDFFPESGGTRVVRTMRLFATSRFGWLALWTISFFLKQAIVRHLRVMRDANPVGAEDSP